MLWRAAKVIHMETEIFAISVAVSREDGERAGRAKESKKDFLFRVDENAEGEGEVIDSVLTAPEKTTREFTVAFIPVVPKFHNYCLRVLLVA